MKDIIKFIYKNTGFIYKAIIFLTALLLIVYFFPKEGQFKYDFEKNKPWQYENLYAPTDFAIKKSEDLIANEKDSIRKTTPYFVISKDFDISNVLKTTTKAINEKSSALNPAELRFLKNINRRIVKKIYEIGIIDQKPKDFDSRKVMLIEGKKVKEINPQLIYTIHDIKNLLSPYFTEKRSLEKQLLEVYYENLLTNLSMDSFYYEKTLKQNLENVSANKGLVLKGAHIVSKGEIINQNIY